MTNPQIQTHRIGDCGLTIHKSITIGSNRVDTPTKAIEIGKTSRYDEVAQEARGINEIYRTCDSSGIENARRGLDRKIENKVKKALRQSHDGEINIVILNYEESREISRGNLQWMVESLDDYSDLIVVPLMPEIARNAINGSNDQEPEDTASFTRYLHNVKEFLQIIKEQDITTPIMGTLPVILPWECNNILFKTYRDYGVDAFCANFDGRTVRADRQLNEFVQPLIEELREREIAKDTLTYALNLKPGQSKKGSPITPARDFMAVAHGFDIIGENHIGLRAPPDVIEKIQEQQEKEETTISIFDRSRYQYRECTISEIDDHFPSTTRLDMSRIKNRIRERGRTPYRIQSLLNAEQIALESKNLRRMIQAEDVESHLLSKPGVEESEIESMELVRGSFEP